MTELKIHTIADAHLLPEEPMGETLLNHENPPLRIWRPKTSVIVLGRSQKAENEIFIEAALEDQIPVFQRHGGGGCVVLDENCICIGMRYPKKGRLNVTEFLEHSSKGIHLFLKETYGLETEIRENHDLTIDNRKFLGCSLYMPKDYCIYLAVLLMDRAAMDKINKYLTMPSKEPSHRQNRSHDDFLTPLFDHIDADYDGFMAEMTEFMEATAWTDGP